MDTLVENFSIETLIKFFKKASSNFKKEQEDLNYILEKRDYALFSNLERVGNISFKNMDELIIFACRYQGELSERSSKKKQFDIAKIILKDDFKDGAIFVFYDNTGKFRFSFIKKNWGEKGENKYTSWRRFTFFVNIEGTNKTFKKRLSECSFKDLQSIEDAFSVEKLTKDFYNDLFKWYSWVLTDEVGVTFPNDTDIAEDDRTRLEEQIIRLITRVLFVWFIKQKHLVPNHLFDKEKLSEILRDFVPNSSSDGNYYNAILQNLFFATLNKPIQERDFAKLKNNRDIKTLYRYAEMFTISEEEILDLFRPIPFLNGGLFECLDKEQRMDGKKYHLDGFSRNAEKSKNGNFKHRAFIPNCVFFGDDKNEGLIPLLGRYNFTVEENAPNEQQVALDPELLGNVFENLLGAFNEETKETARKQSGSFYTPREVVDFMVDESLKAFLKSEDEKEMEFLEILFAENSPENDIFLQNNKNICQKFSEKLKNIKIIDPACGSGAFPMGILNRLVEILERLDVENQKSHHDLKLELIKNCIFGIDIQSIAVQISKLRFFISLIVEQEAMDFSKENYGVHTLPNLETKFVAANSLISIRGNAKEIQGNLFDTHIQDIKDELIKIRKEHFDAKNVNQKKTLREKDKNLREKLSEILKEEGQFSSENVKKFAQLNPYDQNSTSEFFDMEWMFGVEKGFDIVIGNPPYIQLQKGLAKLYEDENFETFARTGDIYCLFYEKGWQILKPQGVLAYITSNKWMRAGYGENLRKFFVKKTNTLQLIDFAGVKVFESATVDTNILLFAKENNTFSTRSCVVKEKELKKLSDYFRHHATICQFKDENSWVILSEIEQRIKAKIEAVGTPLKDWDIQINYGIKTGFNEAFIINGEKRKELIEADPKSAEIIRPLLRGRDIKRYSYDFADLYLIFIPWHFPLHNDPKITGASKEAEKAFENQYPAIYNHLLQYKKELSNRNKAETGIRYEWYALQRWGANYWEEFSKQKIAWNRIASEKLFSLVDEGFMIQDSMHFFTGKNLKYLSAILNSTLFRWFMYLIVGDAAGGNAGNSDNVKNLKIPFPSIETEKYIENLLINEDYKKIDGYFYKLYNLTEEEIQFIENKL